MKYVIESLIPPRLIKSQGEFYIVPQWIKVPSDTTEDQIVHKLPEYLNKDKPVTVGKFKSSSGNNTYIVTKKGNSYQCDCPGYTFRKKCKHTELAKQ